MKKIYLIAILLLSGLLYSCEKGEGTLTPSGIEEGYHMPQGNNPFDATIMGYYEKYGSCFLYNFTDKDTYWTPSGWKNGVTSSTMTGGTPGYLVTPAEPEYIPQQLALIEKCWLNLYSDAFLKKFLPLKIMLCSSVSTVTLLFTPSPAHYGTTPVDAYFNYDNICVNYGNESVLTMNASKELALSRTLSRLFVELIVSRGMSSPSDLPAFTSVVSYSGLSNLKTVSAGFARGFFPMPSSTTSTIDWKKFMLLMVSYPESYLYRNKAITNDSWDTTEAAWEGILNPTKDTKGLMKKRYDMVRNYFIEKYNMDLQSIGNRFNY